MDRGFGALRVGRSQTERPYRSPTNVSDEWGYAEDDSFPEKWGYTDNDSN